MAKKAKKTAKTATDHPFAEKRPFEFVRRATRLSRKDQDAILGGNAAKLPGDFD